MERFSFASNGSAQKSWESCPGSYNGGGGGGGGGGGNAGGYQTRVSSVSGYVNGYNPSLPAYPPTRAQLEAGAKSGGGGGGGGSGGQSFAAQMTAQFAREKQQAGNFRPPPGQDFSKLTENSSGMTYSGHGAWDGPAPMGDPSKPAPGTPYYLKEAPEPAHDPSKEERDVPLGVGGGGCGRLPMLGCDSAHAAIAVPLGYRHVRCGAASTDPNLAAAAASIAAAPNGGRAAIFISAKIAPAEIADPAAACDALLAALQVASLDLLSIEWPVGDPTELAATWCKLEALVDAGKTKAIGLTNASVPIVESICKSARIKPAVNEVEAHPLMAHRKLVGVCRRYGVTPAAFGPLGCLDQKLVQHPKLLEAATVSGSRTVEELLVRWSVQRGVPFSIDAAATPAAVAACADTHGFRLTNKQKVAIDAMEPPPKDGGVRFVQAPTGVAFAFDDPFLGGATRAGLELEKLGLL